MTDARQLQLFIGCPFGGCEDGYCACLEQDVDASRYEGGGEEFDPDGFGEEFVYVRTRTVRRYCSECGQVVQAAEDDPDLVPYHRRYEGDDHVRCPASRTRRRMEVAP